jgi:hypothetical protein
LFTALHYAEKGKKRFPPFCSSQSIAKRRSSAGGAMGHEQPARAHYQYREREQNYSAKPTQHQAPQRTE